MAQRRRSIRRNLIKLSAVYATVSSLRKFLWNSLPYSRKWRI